MGAQFQISFSYLWAMLFSNAIFFAGDWAICYPAMLFHSSFASRMGNDPRTRILDMSRPGLWAIDSNEIPVLNPALYEASDDDSLGRQDKITRMTNDPRRLEFSIHDRIPTKYFDPPAPSPEFKAWPSGVRAGIPGLARRRLVERLARLSCSL